MTGKINRSIEDFLILFAFGCCLCCIVVIFESVTAYHRLSCFLTTMVHVVDQSINSELPRRRSYEYERLCEIASATCSACHHCQWSWQRRSHLSAFKDRPDRRPPMRRPTFFKSTNMTKTFAVLTVRRTDVNKKSPRHRKQQESIRWRTLLANVRDE